MCSPGYVFGSEKPGDTGHFTQVVWKDSKKLGVGKATGKKQNMTCTYVVARYQPRGNIVSQFKDNVQKGTFNDGKCADLEKDTQDIDAETGTGTAALKEDKADLMLSGLGVVDSAGGRAKDNWKGASISASGFGSRIRKINKHGNSVAFDGKDGENKEDDKKDADKDKGDKDKGDKEKKPKDKKGDDKEEEPATLSDSEGPVNKTSKGSKFQEEALAAHNMFRKIHGTPEMSLDKSMSNEAEAYAKLLAADEVLFHSSTKDGENLAKGCNDRNKTFNAGEAVKDW